MDPIYYIFIALSLLYVYDFFAMRAYNKKHKHKK